MYYLLYEQEQYVTIGVLSV